MKSKLMKFLMIAVILALVATACGDDGDEVAEDGATSLEGTAPGSGAATDAEGDTPTLAAESEEAMEDSSGIGPSTTIAAGGQALQRDAAAPESAAEGGFFGSDQDDEASDASESEDNTFRDYGVRPFIDTDRDPLSTFALDVDTASYSIAERWVESGQVPPVESVRVEEYVNSFDYDYRAPNQGLTVVADAGPSPYDAGNVIVRLGVQAERVAGADRPPASLTFVVDTSGSMDRQNRLGLVKASLQRLVVELDSDDVVSIVTYSDNADILLPPTSVEDADTILAAIDGLRTDGSTNLEAGLQRGYDLANEAFREGGINRVILASDGVANVGLTDPDALVELIRGDADRGIQLVTVGVGMGNFNDVTMEQLANDGDGFYAYVNDVTEAERLFSDDLTSTLLTVAIDGKIQVEFDPSTVAQYRLIGFENRAVLDDDFRNDAVDAGELGAGHQVTALYELTLQPDVIAGDRLGTVQLRWEDPDSRTVVESRLELSGAILTDTWSATADDFKLAVTVAAFAELLRESPYTGDISLQQVAEEADALSPGNGSIEQL
ncbi:MAG: von Willebrand factor type A domain-containing protein, partial [Acidimicrobiia bacterium]|nr:von Willebrand factor type A domain-containing protein [Acidimicrobiia bacterium]